MKSIKEMADILDVSKMTVSRYIKTIGATEVAKDGQTLLYDDAVVNLVITGLSKNKKQDTVTTDDTVDFKVEYIKNLEESNNFLKQEIEDKNKQLMSKDEQIESLQTILNQQQQLLLYEQQKNTKLLEENIENKRWWQWWK
ncbi:MULTISPECIES: hypothetical protein [Vagococcus]|uniref:hypothetical protein n=1 Tax=Vagococcus TaxID=2737 RepID=UPI001A8EC58E|nr:MULTISPECIES: hypothetical protein [Vagococcus]MBO0444168.1 hypothetical protein [Vagococcus fluvialis]MCM2140249.1 hypothetical protein [Vagococcus fluvialis]MDT2832236.1 hypothetical protein [Vagococcus carniphilus]MDT2841015.1 hypothetical protein [Vagococcus carniphilus]MDT2855744.1 hypothetical protein [Vagococcus carniphilus]